MPGQLLVSDANVLIDMDAGGLLKAMFALDYDFAVPDILFEEELKAQHPELPRFGLKSLELKAGDLGLSAINLPTPSAKPNRFLVNCKKRR